MNTQPTPPSSETFSDRIKVLIQRVGSATKIARMCGFSEGVVRSWRDGNTDPSRARCVTIARTLGISLVWLVAGEGTLQADPTTPLLADQYSADTVTPQRSRPKSSTLGSVEKPSIDGARLTAAIQILQSELGLANYQLYLPENTDLVTQIYDILEPGGSRVNSAAMMAFNEKLMARIRKDRGLI